MREEIDILCIVKEKVFLCLVISKDQSLIFSLNRQTVLHLALA